MTSNARKLIQVVQVAPGYALLTMPIQDCISLKVNGEEIGRTPFIHFWIQVAGSEEYVEVMPGVSAKRDYFYSVADHTSNSIIGTFASQGILLTSFVSAGKSW